MIRVVNDTLLNSLVIEAKNSPRKRAHFAFHEPQELVQRMVNVLTRGTYIPPHKHHDPDKVEHFVCIKGKIALVSHAESGDIDEVIILSEGGPIYAVDITPNTYHMFVCLSETAIMVEIVEGPYDPATHKKFAPFAPKEGSPEVEAFLASVTERIQNER